MRGRILVSTLLLGAMAVAPIGGSSAATKPERGYITDGIFLPVNSQQADQFGRDVDSDGHKDNALGQVLATFAGQGLDLTAVMGLALTSGDIVMLHSLRTFSLANSNNATWQVWYGKPTLTPPDLTGAGTFPLKASQPHSEKIAATIKDHVVKTAAGAIPVRLDFGSGPFLLNMTKAKLFATCSKAGCAQGRIAGALSAQQIDGKVIPELAELFTDMLVADCTDPGTGSDPLVCESGSTGDTVDGLFNDQDAPDLVITADELRENTTIQAVLSPDLDLVGNDDVKESMSFGFGFTTVKATLTRP